MVQAMKCVAALNTELSVEERNLLSVAYKNVVGSRRNSWRIISTVESKEEAREHSQRLSLVRAYRSEIERELRVICRDILQLLDDHLLPAARSEESKVFYYKMYVSYSCVKCETYIAESSWHFVCHYRISTSLL